MSEIPFEALRRWTVEQALPLWSTAGLDAPGLGFVEQLDLQGRRDDPPFKRVRVQARQIYVFSHAKVLGWAPHGDAAAQAGWNFLKSHGRLDGGGWARTLGREGGVLDSTLDLYDQAFVMLALAWLHRATGEAEPLSEAHATLDAIERRLGRPDGRGFLAALPSPGVELQNPHMHLLEAALALYEASGEDRWADLARRLMRLFDEALFDPKTGTLAETFGEADWRRPSGDGPEPIEPGHQFEWVWLLDRAERSMGGDRTPAIHALFRFGAAHGLDPKTCGAVDEVDEAGDRRRGSARLWPQTELLKAQLARFERGEAPNLDGIARTARLIHDRYLAPAPRGCWYDQYDADGRMIADKIPASSLYHLFVAISELLRLEPELREAQR